MQGLLDEAKQQGEANGMNGHATPGIQSTIPGFQVSNLSRVPFVTAAFDQRPCMHHLVPCDCCALFSTSRTLPCCHLLEAIP